MAVKAWFMPRFSATSLPAIVSFLLFVISMTQASPVNKTAFTRCDGVSTFSCITDNRCIHQDFVCDGVVNCDDGSDEIICSNLECKGDFWFLCDNKHCISQKWRCDFSNDCQDWSDEMDCSQDVVASKEKKQHCKHDEFMCNSGLCIQASWVCDGEDDCKDKEDEELAMCLKRTLVEKSCPETDFTCNNGNCIPHSWVCDGTKDCLDGSDEVKDQCNSRLSGSCDQHEGRFQCHDKSFCLDPHLVCDGNADCKDSSDEGTFCDTTPSCHVIDCSRAHGCIRRENGPVCYCQEGLQMVNGTCQDRDECEDYGSCSQNCHNTDGSYFCSCNSGYGYSHDNREVNGTCLSLGDEPTLYFATKTGVRGLNLRSGSYYPIAWDLDHVIGVGYDGVDGRVYWTSVENGKEMIVSGRKDGMDKKDVVTKGLDMPEDIAVDEISRNIYFTDSHKKHVAVCKLDGSACTVLATEDVDLPRAIALHILKKVLVYSDWGANSAIVIMGMDGSNRKNLVDKDLKWPNGIAVDTVLDRIYWSDAKKEMIECIKLDGTDRRTILDQKVMHPFSLAVFEDTLYWSDWKNKAIQSCNKFTGKDEKNLVKEADIRPMGISVYHPSQNEKIANPCINSGCSHLCLPRPQDGIGSPGPSHICACPSHLILDTDKATCKFQSDNHYVVVSTGDKLYRMLPRILGKNSFDLLGSLNNGIITSISTDSLENKIYVGDKKSSKINHLELKTKTWSTVSTVGDSSAIVVDPLARNLYWIDTVKSSIMVQSLTTKARKSLVENLQNPTALIFLPPYNMLVFTQVIPFFHSSSISSVTTGRVSTCNTDGSEVKEVEILTGILSRPTALVFQQTKNTVYIADAGKRAILKWEVGTHKAAVFLNGLNDVVSMAISDGYMYWLELGSNNVFWVSIENKAGMLFAKDINWMSLNPIMASQVPGQNLMRLGVFSDAKEFKNLARPCEVPHCSDLCFGTQMREFECSCPYGMVLSANKVDCEPDCPDNTFKCGNSQCIPPNWVCDGQDDCFNGQDELDCANKTTEACPGQARCDDGVCLPPSFFCDGDRDCADGSDETKDCPPIAFHLCNDGKFRCKNGKQCLPAVWKCDGTNDCTDGSDEEECKGCGKDKFECKINKVCIERKWMCDGRADCLDASDEMNCTPVTHCGIDFFKCDNDKCVDLNLACDGRDDCGDGSDEYKGVCPHHERDELPEMIDCDNGFQCDNTCLPEAVRCNGTSECTNNADEMYCSICTSDTFRCNDGEQCIKKEWLCDKTEDCSDGSDETDCNLLRIHFIEKPKMFCGKDEYKCKTGKCIDLKFTCNGINDCEDGSDEHEDNCLMCHLRNGGCQQICIGTPEGPICRCNAGYEEKIVNGTVLCEDVDECNEITSCAQRCDNTKGGFKCSCDDGYVAEEEGRLCRAKGETAKLMYASMMNIMAIEMVPSQQKVELEFSNHQTLIKSFDFNLITGDLYFTSPAMGIIGKQRLSRFARESRIHMILKNLDNPDLLAKPDQIAVDWSTNNIYFSHQGSRDITACSSGQCRNILEIQPSTASHLALDPSEGVLFVAGYSRRPNTFPEGGIWVYGMDGSSLDGVGKITGEKVGMPSGLTLDLLMKRVFWSDYTNKQISMCGYHGEHFQVVTRTAQMHPSWLSLYESTLYWISGSHGQVFSHNLVSDVHMDQQPINILPNSHSLKFAQESRQPRIENPCIKMRCGGLCLVAYRGEAVCACPTGQVPTDSLSVHCIPSPSSPPSIQISAEPVNSAASMHVQMNDVEDDMVQQVLVEPESHSSHVYGAVAGVVVVVLLIVVGILTAVYVRSRQSKDRLSLLRFENPIHGFEPNDSRSDQSGDMSAVRVDRRGTTTAVVNPGFETPDHNMGEMSRLEFYRPAIPIISTPDWPNTSPNTSPTAILKAKGCSTPNLGRDEKLQGVCRLPGALPNSCDDSMDHNLSVSFHKDNERLIPSDCE